MSGAFFNATPMIRRSGAEEIDDRRHSSRGISGAEAKRFTLRLHRANNRDEMAGFHK